MNNIDELAKVLWDYHRLNQEVQKSDCIIALGNSDVRTAHKAADLVLQGYANLLVTTGGLGRLTSSKFKKPEAQVFAEIALQKGVPAENIIIEDKSSNTFENIRNVAAALKERNIDAHSFIIVTKPYMERRAKAMFAKIWPDQKVAVTSPDLDYDSYPNGSISKELMINMMAGDLQRIIVYGERGGLERQRIPYDVLAAYEKLIEAGFDKQMVDPAKLPEKF